MPNRFRPDYRPLSYEEATLVAAVKDTAEHLALLIDAIGARDGALAQTHLEIAVMFAVKGITR